MTTKTEAKQLELPNMPEVTKKMPPTWHVLTEKDHHKAGRLQAVKRPPRKK